MYNTMSGQGGGYGNNTAFIKQENNGFNNGGGGPDQAMQQDTLMQAQELRSELAQLDSSQFKHAHQLVKSKLEDLDSGANEPPWLDLDGQLTIKVVKKVVIPSHKFPKFNFVGKLLGPGGKTLQALAKDNKCHVYILGGGSTRDRSKEEEQLNSGDPQHAHFALPLHVKVETSAAPHVAYERIASVLKELAVILQPVRDDIVASQMSEMGKPFQPDPPASRGRGGFMGGGRGGFGNQGMRGGGMNRGGMGAPPRGGRGGFPGGGGGFAGGRGAQQARIAPAGPVSYSGFGSTFDGGPGGKMRGGFSTAPPQRNYNPY